MTSDTQLETNRSQINKANAQKSTGPTSEAGKAAVRFNATRHGLTSQVACMTWEDRDAFNQFCASIVTELKPEGAIEAQLAQSIAEDHWRLNRARAIEENLFALGLQASTLDTGDPQATAALSQAETFRDNLKSFNLITLYESRLNRNVDRNMHQLRQLQTERRAARAAALSELAALNSTSQSFASTHNGFDFSEAEIAAASQRQRFAELAAEVDYMAKNPIRMPQHPLRKSA